MVFVPPKFPGGRDSCGVGHHCLGDVTLAAPGFPVHNLLCLQVLPGQEEKARAIYNLKISCLCPCATDVLHIWHHPVIKPHLVNAPSSSCQTLEVPLCPDFELACPPACGISKGQAWYMCSWVKRSGSVAQAVSVEHIRSFKFQGRD